MAFEFHLPDLAEGMTEAEVVDWKVKVGDTVKLDQPVVEVMSDKATVEIPSPRAGTITKLNFEAGQICPVGHVLFIIEDGAAVAATARAPAATSNGNGAHVSSPVAAATPPRPEVIDATADRQRVLATPATRRFARQQGVDLASVPGTGPRGRISREDVERFQQGGAAVGELTREESSSAGKEQRAWRPPGRERGATPPSGEISSARGATPPAGERSSADDVRIPFRGMRKRIAENMSRAKNTAAHFTYVEEIDTTDLVAVRERAKARAAERDVKLTYLPFIVKAVVAGLKKWPALNASLDEAAQEIVQKRSYHIGIATQGPQGLAVSVVRDADKRSIFELAAEISRLAKAVADGTATRDDLSGSTFTISSLGKLGGVLATPIINVPEVGILGVHKMEEKAVVVNHEIAIRWRMNLSISLDHRLVDGWDGAMFLQDVKTLLEDPTLMFMEMV